MRTSVVTTTIFEPSNALRVLGDGCIEHYWEGVVIGDEKTPSHWRCDGLNFFSAKTQQSLQFESIHNTPFNSYARKNIGYLIAANNGADVIIDIDDDNVPMVNFWKLPPLQFRNDLTRGEATNSWVNVYDIFRSEDGPYGRDPIIWPRGLPLDCIYNKSKTVEGGLITSPIQQGLADKDPDVDAIWRLLNKQEFYFSTQDPVTLDALTWCPFNSQNTVWYREALPLMYLPSTCNMRVADIWRSFVAQRIAWEMGWRVTFNSATVYQERNLHDLMSDFWLESVGYNFNKVFQKILQGQTLKKGDMCDNMRSCYKSLVKSTLIHEDELLRLDAWIEDCNKLKTL